ncbi:MAG TPA: hypothetical protein VIP05_35645, partial [Burkholderiaceae bacterium]
MPPRPPRPLSFRPRFVAGAALLAVSRAALAQSVDVAVASLERPQQVVVAAHYDDAVGSSDAASQGVVRGE